MADVSVRFDDHTAELIKKLGEKAKVALEAVGVQAEAVTAGSSPPSLPSGYWVSFANPAAD